MAEKKLNDNQIKFCSEYAFDLNGKRAYIVAYPECKSEKAAYVSSFRLLKNDKIQKEISSQRNRIEERLNLTKERVLNEFKKISFSNIADLHNTWIERKELDNLTKEEKSCISEISTKVERRYDHNEQKQYFVEYVKIKLHDKQKALENICKILGYNAEIDLPLHPYSPAKINIQIFNVEQKGTNGKRNGKRRINIQSNASVPKKSRSL